VIIVHRTAAGEAFRALYGQVSGLKYKAGARVAVGAVIATINGRAHLHLSMYPSAVYRDGNPYACCRKPVCGATVSPLSRCEAAR